MAENVCFVDCETLGLDADHHPMWEIAWITPEGREHEILIEVTERDIALADPIGLQISGFKDRYQRDVALLPHEAAMELWDYIPRDCHLAGMVVSFDEERMRRLLWRYGYMPPWHYHLIDVENLAAGWLAAQTPMSTTPLPPWKSETLSAAIGVDPAKFDRHTALGDARWAKAIYETVMKRWSPDA